MAEEDQDQGTQDELEDDASSTTSEESSEESSGETPDELTTIKAELVEKAAELDKLNRDYSSLKGQLKPQYESEAAMRDEVSAIHKQLAVLAKAVVSGESEDLSTEYEQVQSELGSAKQSRTLQRYYDEAVAEIKSAVVGEDGKVLLDLESDAEEIVALRILWQAGQSGKSGDQDLTPDERMNKFSQAVGQAHKFARAEERKQLRTKSDKEKSERETARKAAREESGELELDTGVSAGAGTDTEDMSPRERISAGLARAKKTGKKSTLFV